MNVVPILLLLLPVVFILAAVIALIVALVQSNRRMKQSQKMFNDIWNQRMGDAQGRDAAQNPVADMLNNPFQTFNRVFESVTQQIEADNRAPQLQVNARVLSRRQSFYGSSVGAQHSSTSHYITFELENGDRMELRLSGAEYGLLVEGDEGVLTYQGSRYVRFERRAASYTAYRNDEWH
jgi:hypothetical protein